MHTLKVLVFMNKIKSFKDFILEKIYMLKQNQKALQEHDKKQCQIIYFVRKRKGHL
jgi:hypothetical protein